ncbi:MAG: aminotransferase class I/II-fold pyridoxal phosphate-dependent enzyme [Phycisphaerales bacterium]|nr:aminotransferase class I/II-fold pyridoxal phosphate-dependent enzyme [Phycisphaerales bacterium]
MNTHRIEIAPRFRPFGTTIFTQMTNLARTHHAVNLSQGFPDSDGPQIGKDAAREALQSGVNQYAPLPGLPELRAAVSNWSRDMNTLQCDPDSEVTITSGCTEAIVATMLGLVDQGDEVILFEPFYDSYRAAVAMAGGIPKFVTIQPDGGRFGFDEQQLRNAFTERTRAVLINTPHNPTGMVFDQDQLKLIADLCVEHDVLAFSDEVYEQLIFDDHKHRSIATLPSMKDRTVVMSSIGKIFSFTGWKVGWTIAPAHLTAGIRAAHQFLTFSVPGPLQMGSAALLNDARDEARAIREQFTATRGVLAEALDDLGFDVHRPEGAFFIMAGHERVSERLGCKDDVDLCTWLPKHAGVAAIPPSVFYDDTALGSGFVRFAFCKRMSTIDEAIKRMQRALQR